MRYFFRRIFTERTKLFLVALSVAHCLTAQDIKLPTKLPQGHPRQMVTQNEKKALIKTIKGEEWAADIYAKLKERTDVYVSHVQTEPDWLYSRLQMNWKTHFTDIYINGENYDHAGGDRAPEPTVKFVGTRGTASQYNRPALEDIVPYDDDDNGNVTYIPRNNKNGDGHSATMEKAHPSKTGRNIENVNRQIMGIARDAAFLYWTSGEKQYAELAAGVIDVFLAGLYYRNVPIDLNHGHQQTLVGMTSFEVIHEDIVQETTAAYDFLFDYLKQTRPERMSIYADALKKWADCIIANGVPHNNWNLFQAMFIIKIALVLEDNHTYSDGKGRGYYLDYVLNRSSIRQWSLQKLADYGFDPNTSIWAESAGYSSNVVCDYLDLAYELRRTTGIDIIKEIPVLSRAAAAMTQYLFPNKMICGFGDTHPSFMRQSGLRRMIEYAQQTKDVETEKFYTSLLKSIDETAGTEEQQKLSVAVSSLLSDKPLKLSESIQGDNLARFVSPTFYAQKVSWIALRNGMDKEHSLMISLNGSMGNHQHANGISMELYGRGYVLGPDGGIGKLLYSGLDYSEYYSQFPAHNTVCVDGVSSYPVMMSHHPFKLMSAYPSPETTEQTVRHDLDKDSPFSFAQVYFREPESMADQVRSVGIVTNEDGGYYVDIFRSRKVEGGDKMHDYFYHNLGQGMTLTSTDGTPLPMQPTEELAFAGGHLNAYSYIYEKRSCTTTKDVKAVFSTSLSDSSTIDMTMWMRGDQNRTVFQALSPANEEYDRMPNQPYKLKDAPVLTFIARQYGEAWNKPFVVIFEPSRGVQTATIQQVSYFSAISADTLTSQSFAGIAVKTKRGHTDYIFSAYKPTTPLTYQGMTMQGDYAVFSHDRLLLVNGTHLEREDVSITAEQPTSVLMEKKDGHWQVKAEGACVVKVDGKTIYN